MRNRIRDFSSPRRVNAPEWRFIWIILQLYFEENCLTIFSVGNGGLYQKEYNFPKTQKRSLKNELSEDSDNYLQNAVEKPSIYA